MHRHIHIDHGQGTSATTPKTFHTYSSPTNTSIQTLYIYIHTISVSDSHERIHPPRPHPPPIPQTNIFYILYIYIALTFFSCHICPKPYTCWVMIRIPNFVYMLWYFFFSRPIHSLLCTRWTGSNVNIRVLLPVDVSCNRSSYWWNICPHSDHRNCLFCSTEKVKVWNIISIINLHIKNYRKTTISKMRESELFCWYM